MVMVEVYVDESEDDKSFTLAAWEAPPVTGWNNVIAAWKEMIEEQTTQIEERLSLRPDYFLRASATNIE